MVEKPVFWAKTWNRGEVGRTAGKVPDGRPTRRIWWKNQFSGRKCGPKRDNVEPGRSRPDVVKSTRRASDTEDTVEKPVFSAKTWAETRKRGNMAKSAGRREKYPTGARHGGYCGKTSILGESVETGRSRPDVVKSTRRAPDTKDTVENQFSGRKRGPKRENVEPGRSRPDVVKSPRRAPDTQDTGENQYSGRKRGPKRENVEPGRSRPDVVKSTRRAPDTEDTVEKPVFWAKTWTETRKRGTGAKSAGRREKYPTGARHGGYGGKTSFLGENVGRNAKTLNRGEVGRTS